MLPKHSKWGNLFDSGTCHNLIDRWPFLCRLDLVHWYEVVHTRPLLSGKPIFFFCSSKGGHMNNFQIQINPESFCEIARLRPWAEWVKMYKYSCIWTHIIWATTGDESNLFPKKKYFWDSEMAFETHSRDILQKIILTDRFHSLETVLLAMTRGSYWATRAVHVTRTWNEWGSNVVT